MIYASTDPALLKFLVGEARDRVALHIIYNKYVMRRSRKTWLSLTRKQAPYEELARLDFIRQKMMEFGVSRYWDMVLVEWGLRKY